MKSVAERIKDVGCLRLGVVLTVSACLGCVVLLCVGQVVAARVNPTNQATLCVGMVVTGRTQVGVWWQSIFMSRLMIAATSPYTLCTGIPWPSSLPAVGEAAFPP